MNYDAERYDKKADEVASHFKGVARQLREQVNSGLFYTNRWANMKLMERVCSSAPSPELTICEWGCYLGTPSLFVSSRLPGARVRAFDISPASVDLASRLGQELGLQVDFECMDATSLQYPDQSIDVAFGFGVLHHVHRPETYQELCRVLKKGGEAIFIEPTRFNPLINLYRKIRREKYSPDERPFTMDMFEEIRGWIPGCELSWQGEQFLTMFALLADTLFRKALPKVADSQGFQKNLARTLHALGRIDDRLINSLPLLQRNCQLITLVVRKPV